jgi:hypothetical protein
MFNALNRQTLFAVIKACLVQNVDHVAPETGRAFIQPKAQNIFYLFDYLWIFVIKVGLFFIKKVQIIFSAFFVLLPGLSHKKSRPVVWRFTVPAGAPDIVIAVWT